METIQTKSSSNVSGAKWSDFFINPKRFFESLKEKPNVCKPFVLTTIPIILMYMIIVPNMMDIFTRNFSDFNIGSSSRIESLMYILICSFSIFQTVMALFLGAIILHLMCIPMLGKGSIKQTTSLFMFVSIPGAIKAIGIILISFVMGSNFSEFVKGFLVGKSFYLSLFDPFAIWTSLLIIIGLNVIHEISWLKASIISIIILVIKILIS
ncbi:ABC transporter permease [Bacillus cereus]|nr:ABC transporter permease [Bacillus cereus]PGV91799.1 ABC transporter permease [Bacillus cereus]